ncbi:MAG: hypothetical protein ACI4U4_04490 [Bacilli bacterium]
MKNILEFYYNLSLEEEILNRNGNYYFVVNNNSFVFRPFYGNNNSIDDIYKLNNYLSNFSYIDKIILNKFNSPVTKVKDNLYVLILLKGNNNISLSIISNLASIDIPSFKSLERNNWEVLWGNLIDYYEMQIGQNEKKYPLIRESFDYFVGMGENAISYLVNTKKEVKPNFYDKKVLSHNNLYNSLFDPLNIILDHKARDLAEYIKLSFFNNNQNIFKELDEYFYYNHYSFYGMRILFARIMYPSFYFKLYDEILSKKKEEKELNSIIKRIDEYELFLSNIYFYLRKYYDIPMIEWLKKTRT